MIHAPVSMTPYLLLAGVLIGTVIVGLLLTRFVLPRIPAHEADQHWHGIPVHTADDFPRDGFALIGKNDILVYSERSGKILRPSFYPGQAVPVTGDPREHFAWVAAQPPTWPLDGSALSVADHYIERTQALRDHICGAWNALGDEVERTVWPTRA